MKHLLTRSKENIRVLKKLLILVVFSIFIDYSLTYAGEIENQSTKENILEATNALDRDEYLAAVVKYRKAAESSNDVELAKISSKLAYSYGLNREGLVSTKLWLKLEKDSEQALIYLSKFSIRQEKYSLARRYISQILKKDPETAGKKLLSMTSILSEGSVNNIYNMIFDLAKKYPKSADAHAAVATMALKNNNANEAIRRSKLAMEISPGWIQPKLIYARSLLLDGDSEAAIDYVARIIGDEPRPDPKTRLELAILFLREGRSDDAMSQVNQILLEYSSQPEALRLMGIINFSLNYLDLAREDFQDLLATGFYEKDAIYYLARIADLNSDFALATALYMRVTSGSNAIISQRRASQLLLDNKKPTAALILLRDFGKNYPAFAIQMIKERAEVNEIQGNYIEALRLYDDFIHFRPDDESTLLSSSELLLKMGRLKEAVARYRDAVSKFPDSPASLNALGYTLADKTNSFRQAEKLIKKALKYDPNNPAILDSYGWVLYKRGKLEKALSQLHLAYNGYRDPEIASHLVEVLWKLGKTEEAKQLLEEAELENPLHPLLQNIREKIL